MLAVAKMKQEGTDRSTVRQSLGGMDGDLTDGAGEEQSHTRN